MWHTGLVAPGHVGSSQTRDQTHVSASAGRFFTTEPPGKPGYEVLQSTLRLWPTGGPRFMNGDFETESKIRGSHKGTIETGASSVF